ncbi:MAG: aromatic amino acid lyase [Cyanobacteria bacterium HKST-UBA02]|nr:aromatic amino acid lyase [Cyanobacteria bacterium HKST-UBA02]
MTTARAALALGERDLSLEDLAGIAREGVQVGLSPEVMENCFSSYVRLAGLVAGDRNVYGLTVACGQLDDVEVAPENRSQLDLVRAHASGVGEPMRFDQSRAMMASRLHTLARGMSGVSPQTLAALIAYLNADLAAAVPELGSVGSSDLAPLAHMALALCGEGETLYRDKSGTIKGILSREALELAGLELLELQGRDGLALINGLSQTIGLASLCLIDLKMSLNTSACAAALTGLALYPGGDRNQAASLALKKHPAGSELVARLESLIENDSKDNPEIRSALSIRYALPVLATAVDSYRQTRAVVEAELNAVVDNPLLFQDGSHTNNSGNTCGQRIATSLDQLSIALSALCVATEHRIARLISRTPAGGLPPYLVHPDNEPGASYGLMYAQYTAASLTGEIRARCQPRSISSLAAGGDLEDLNSFAAGAALHLEWLRGMLDYLIAIETMAAVQAFDCLARELPGKLAPFARSVRETVPVLKEARPLGPDIDRLKEAMREGRLNPPEIIG